MRGNTRALAAAPDLRWVACFMLAALVLGCFRLGDKGLWVDEAVSLRFALQARSTWLEDNNMALFYALLSGMVRVFGASEVALRGFSVACFVASVPAFYALLRRAFGAREARIGCALLVANAFVLRFAQEARGYMLALLLVTTASWALLRLVQTPKMRWAITYGVVIGLALYAHAFALWILLAHACAVLWLLWRVPSLSCSRADARASTLRWLLPAFTLAGLFAAPLVIQAMRAGTSQISWLKRPTWASCAELFRLFAGGSALLALAYGLLWLLFVAFAAAHVLGLRRAPGDGPRQAQLGFGYVLVAAWFALPVAATLAISLLVTPIVHPKYLLVALPGLLAGVALCLARVRSCGVLLALSAVFLLLSGSSLYDWYARQEKERWREAVALLRERLRANDALVLDVGAPEPFDYYVLRAKARLPQPLVPERAWSVPWSELREQSPSERAARLDAAPRIWLVRNRSNDAALRAQILRQHPAVTTIKLEPRDGDERALFASAEGRIIYLESFTRLPAASPSR